MKKLTEEQAKEIYTNIIENRKNPISWIENNIKISHPAHGTINFSMYEFQKKIINLFLLKHFIITLKSRQIGMSTIIQSLCLWCAMHYMEYTILILSAGQRNATKFLSKIRKMYASLPDNEFKLQLDIDNKQSLSFKNGSSITAIPATRAASLGESINLLVIDEAAHIEKIKEVYQGAYPTISRAFKSMKGKPYGIIIISTPNGVSGTGQWFHEMYEGALNKESKYIPLKVHWTAVKEYDEEWYLDQCKQLLWDYKSIMAEFELSFVSSGNTYLPGQILDTIGTIDPIDEDNDSKLWIYEHPIEGETYVAGVDVAYGDKKDSSTIQILKASTLEQVAEYDNNAIIPDKFADVVINLTSYYNNSLCNIERNAVGKVLIDKILSRTDGGIGVNLFRDQDKNDLGKPNIENKDLYKSNIGTNVTGVSRDILLANMYNIVLDKYTEAIDNIIADDDSIEVARAKFEAIMSKDKHTIKKYGIIKSERLLHQLLKFIVDEHGKAKGSKDDLIFGWVHALYAWSKSKHILLRNIKNILSKTLGIDDATRNSMKYIEFMKRKSNSIFWQQLSSKDIQALLDEEYNNDESKIKTEDDEKPSKGIAAIYKAFFNN